MAQISVEEFLDGIKKSIAGLGIKNGDILYVASDLKGFLYKAKEDCGVKGIGPRNELINGLVDILKESVGEEGTILFPVFTWSYCRGKGFDYYKTPSEIGTLNNWVLANRPDFERTQHPMYSFMVYGKHAKELLEMTNQDAWGPASPFAYLLEHNAKQLLFDIEAYQGLTFVHYVEQVIDVPYRHPKYFFGEYTDARGITEVRMYSMYSRDMELTTDVGATNKYLIEKGCANQIIWNELTFTNVDWQAAYPVIYDDILNNNGKDTLYFENYTFDLSKPKTLEYEIGKIPENRKNMEE